MMHFCEGPARREASDEDWDRYVAAVYAAAAGRGPDETPAELAPAVFRPGGRPWVGQGPGTVAVRDTQDRSGPVLRFRTADWAGFTSAVKAGEGISRRSRNI